MSTKVNTIKEAAKEILRTALMSVIPLVVVDLQSNTFHWQTWAIAVVVSILSGLDKWLHVKDTGVMGNGLTGF